MLWQWALYVFLLFYMPINWITSSNQSRIAALSALLPLAFPVYLGSRMNATLRYYYRLTLYCTTLGLTSAWAVFLSIVLSLVGQSHSTQYYVARSFYYFAGPILGWKINVEGWEHLENKESTVFVGNHQSWVLPLILCYLRCGWYNIASSDTRSFPLTQHDRHSVPSTYFSQTMFCNSKAWIEAYAITWMVVSLVFLCRGKLGFPPDNYGQRSVFWAKLSPSFLPPSLLLQPQHVALKHSLLRQT